jgi:DNA replication protein DnaC
MLTQPTIEKLTVMKLYGLLRALEQQLASSEHSSLDLEDRISLLVDAEWNYREQRKLKRRLDAAKLRYQASIEDIDFKHPRQLDRQQVLSLGQCGWISNRHNLVITGPTGIGKSYLACAFVERACRRGMSASYVRLPRLLQTLAIARGDGSYARILVRLAKFELLAIDDWLLAPLRDSERRDLIELIEDRAERASTLIASQVPSDDWHAAIGDPNLADSICERVLHNAHRMPLKGPSIRNTKTSPKIPTGEKP